MNNNKDFVSHEVHLPNDPSINILNQNKISKKHKRYKSKDIIVNIVKILACITTFPILTVILLYLKLHWSIIGIVITLYTLILLLLLITTNKLTMFENKKYDSLFKIIFIALIVSLMFFIIGCLATFVSFERDSTCCRCSKFAEHSFDGRQYCDDHYIEQMGDIIEWSDKQDW